MQLIKKKEYEDILKIILLEISKIAVQSMPLVVFLVAVEDLVYYFFFWLKTVMVVTLHLT